MTTASAFTSEICEYAKCLFISKGETQVEDLKCHTALKIHTAFCCVMSGRWVPVLCRNILASPSHQKAATVQHIIFTCEWYGMSLVEVKELAASFFTLGYPEDVGSWFWNMCDTKFQKTIPSDTHCHESFWPLTFFLCLSILLIR